ncbi:MAG: hypothetical protein ACRDE2_08805, partial [Chitinophagaceae bacterium]
DFYNPDINYRTININLKGYSTTEEIFVTTGLDFILYKDIHIMPNIWFDNYHSKLPQYFNAMKNDYDLVGRIIVYFTFNK